MKEEYLIIVAGGTGSRMKNDLPKQFIEINGEAIIIKTIKAFLNYNSAIKIIISVHPDYKSHLENLILQFKLDQYSIQITHGGNTRFDSVKNGLQLINNPDAIVGIHDAARPFVSQTTISNCYQTAQLKGNAIPCISIFESIRKVETENSHPVNRNHYKIIQTPQCFLVSKIKKAFEQNYQAAFTDDATVLESIGEKINLVEGNEENIKITSPQDLKIAQVFCKHEQ